MLLANRNFFNDFFKDPFFESPIERSATQVMRTDVHENDNSYLVEVELPGYNKEDIKADLKDGYLTVTASHEENQEEKDKKGNCIRKERYTGSCNRSFYIGDHLTQEDIKASFKDGVLHLSIPKDAPKEIEDQAKYITIE
ncbi:Hsp20/alpha crystallin family protein [Clostridium sp. C105KSO13]|uniref:Hsp20/alpha crystallin family protein n=1 Tax=Clostridium sp. C105KSO13 TaxID=1776045 RepID=UPI0007407E3B|nr:Hsp20/alpha crystallin family protein [Clostridium sp. C105KSO13]CUX48363.1 Acid shock protein [Clostridium sp. C105KSO13]